ncbi:unnamed protein product [Sphagnum troendelagicum]|uniref:Uncharacterized protein n=1 Tax=Sphagnum jensenii TaxID=128206 RepID=A0ABP0VYD9_9BRYO
MREDVDVETHYKGHRCEGEMLDSDSEEGEHKQDQQQLMKLHSPVGDTHSMHSEKEVVKTAEAPKGIGIEVKQKRCLGRVQEGGRYFDAMEHDLNQVTA